MDKQQYASKLKDPRWQKKRLEILQRDDFACQSWWFIEEPHRVLQIEQKHMRALRNNRGAK